MSNNYFKGYYLKHQKDNKTIAFIPGISKYNSFIQIITNEQTFNYNFPRIEFAGKIIIGNCEFSMQGIKINLPSISGKIEYSDLTPIKYDIMGPFKFLPMECRHEIFSMHHKLKGSLVIKNQEISFDNGTGYIEKDSGRSFPESYLWLQCNDFDDKLSIMVSIAKIPFMGFKFWGCLCVISFKDKEYRMATYLGVRIIKASRNKIVLMQGKYLLKIQIKLGVSHYLIAPKNGKMRETIRESNNASAKFQFFCENKLIFDVNSENTGYEFVNMD